MTTSAPLTFRGRLPGVLVETALPERGEAPLRLDVAGFVGFAERGPINTPVALEDPAGFTRVFGGDLAVAVENGAPVFAYLPAAVRAFFDNGGRRCFVVRVVGTSQVPGAAGPRPNRLPLPGLVTVDQNGDFRQAIAAASWAGRWSDSMSVATQLRSLPLRIAGEDSYSFVDATQTGQLELYVPSPSTVREGDILSLRFADLLATQIMLRVTRVTVNGRISVHGFPVTLELRSVSPNAAFSAATTLPADAPSTVEQLRENGWQSVAGELYPIVSKTGADAGAHLFLPATAGVNVGDLLRVHYASGEAFYVPVMSVRTHYAPPFGNDAFLATDDPVLPEGVYRRVVSDTMLGQQVLGAGVGTPVAVERLRFDLTIAAGEQTLELLPDLSFNPPAALFESRAGDVQADAPITGYWADRLTKVADDGRAVEPAAFDGRSLHLRAAPAAPPAAAVWLPLAMRSLPTFASPLADTAPDGKDGLDTFSARELFLDPQLRDASVESLLPRAEDILHIRQPGGRLGKLHSLVAIEEIALVGVPDLAHRAWFPQLAAPVPLPVPPPPAPEPDLSRFVECLRPEDIPVPPYDPADAPCSDSPIGLLGEPPPSIEHDPCLQLAGLPELQAPAAYDPAALLDVQAALVTMCAARADVLAILCVPAHFKRAELVDWQTRLVNTPALLGSSAWSYAAAYHGWTLARETTCPALAPVRAVPPEGTLGGMFATRERIRGAWIAPANESLAGVVGLTPRLSDADWEELYNHQINVLRHEPGRFTLMSALTLSQDRLLVQISVRRLLIFLRKLALRRGQRFVFETNNQRFRRQVQLSFERLLAALVERGALVAFQVVTGEEVNTANDEDNGRFFVALKVAPTLPIEFITVVMLRSGDSLQVLER